MDKNNTDYKRQTWRILDSTFQNAQTVAKLFLKNMDFAQANNIVRFTPHCPGCNHRIPQCIDEQ